MPRQEWRADLSVAALGAALEVQSLDSPFERRDGDYLLSALAYGDASLEQLALRQFLEQHAGTLLGREQARKKSGGALACEVLLAALPRALISLDLSRTNFVGRGASFSTFTGLCALDLSGCPVRPVHLKLALATCVNIAALSLRDCTQLTEGMTREEQKSWQATAPSDTDTQSWLHFVCNLPRIRWLDLATPCVSQEDVRAAAPGLLARLAGGTLALEEHVEGRLRQAKTGGYVHKPEVVADMLRWQLEEAANALGLSVSSRADVVELRRLVLVTGARRQHDAALADLLAVDHVAHKSALHVIVHDAEAAMVSRYGLGSAEVEAVRAYEVQRNAVRRLALWGKPPSSSRQDKGGVGGQHAQAASPDSVGSGASRDPFAFVSPSQTWGPGMEEGGHAPPPSSSASSGATAGEADASPRGAGHSSVLRAASTTGSAQTTAACAPPPPVACVASLATPPQEGAPPPLPPSTTPATETSLSPPDVDLLGGASPASTSPGLACGVAHALGLGLGLDLCDSSHYMDVTLEEEGEEEVVENVVAVEVRGSLHAVRGTGLGTHQTMGGTDAMELDAGEREGSGCGEAEGEDVVMRTGGRGEAEGARTPLTAGSYAPADTLQDTQPLTALLVANDDPVAGTAGRKRRLGVTASAAGHSDGHSEEGSHRSHQSGATGVPAAKVARLEGERGGVPSVRRPPAAPSAVPLARALQFDGPQPDGHAARAPGGGDSALNTPRASSTALSARALLSKAGERSTVGVSAVKSGATRRLDRGGLMLPPPQTTKSRPPQLPAQSPLTQTPLSSRMRPLSFSTRPASAMLGPGTLSALSDQLYGTQRGASAVGYLAQVSQAAHRAAALFPQPLQARSPGHADAARLGSTASSGKYSYGGAPSVSSLLRRPPPPSSSSSAGRGTLEYTELLAVQARLDTLERVCAAALHGSVLLPGGATRAKVPTGGGGANTLRLADGTVIKCDALGKPLFLEMHRVRVDVLRQPLRDLQLRIERSVEGQVEARELHARLLDTWRAANATLKKANASGSGAEAARRASTGAPSRPPTADGVGEGPDASALDTPSHPPDVRVGLQLVFDTPSLPVGGVDPAAEAAPPLAAAAVVAGGGQEGCAF